jgi:hypothetical protein
MANFFIILDGGDNNPMDQTGAKNRLQQGISGKRKTNIGQALNDVADGNGNATGAYEFNGQAVLHASAGQRDVSSATLFYILEQDGDLATIFAMGEHVTNTTYKVTDFGQPGTPFQLKKSITLS